MTQPLSRPLLRAIAPQFVVNWVRKLRKSRRDARARSTIAHSIREDDIFIVGHPKSGNTWLAYMLAILVRGDTDRHINLANIGDHVPTIHARDYAIGRFQDLPPPRLFRNEGPMYPELYPKTIYIVRDPRSVLLSYYHHCVHDTGEKDWKLEDFVDEMLSEGCIRRLEPFLIRWDRQLADWTRRAESQPVCFVRYEDLKESRATQLRNLAQFVGVDVSDELLSEAIDRGAFDSMRSEEVTVGAESYAGEKGAKGFFVRKGKIDSWKEEMPPEVIEKIEKAFEPGMRRLSYLS